MRRRFTKPNHLGVWLTLALVLGCDSTPLAQDGVTLEYPDVKGRPRSVVLDAPTLQQLMQLGPTVTERPWYASRNDVRRSAYGGYQSATTDVLVTTVHDRQTSSGNRTRDHYTNITHRQTIRQTIR